MANLIKVNPEPKFNENLYPNSSLTYTILGGAGSTVSLSDFSANKDKSVNLASVNTNTTILDLGESITVPYSGLHAFSLYLWKFNPLYEWQFTVYIYKNGILFQTISADLTNASSNFTDGKWNIYGQVFNYSMGDVVTFRLEAVTSTVGNGLFISAPKFELLNKGFTLPSYYTYPSDYYFTDIDNFIFVDSFDKLPTPITGVINLLDEKTYYFTKNIDLSGNRLVCGENTTILGTSSENASISSTGLGIGIPLITSIYTNPIRNISIKDVDTAFNFDGTTNPSDMALDWTGINFVNVPNVGLIKKASNFIFDKGAFLNSKGLKFDGTIGTIALNNSLFTGDGLAGNIIEVLSTCTITRRFRVTYSSLVASSLTKGISFNTSAVVPVESYILDTVNFSGGGTYLDGVTVSDNKTLFSNCKGISNTAEVSSYYMNGNATTTVISGVGTPVKALGTTTSSAITQKFTNTNNRATYTGSLTRLFSVVITLSVESGNNNQIGCYIAKNGVVLNDSEVYGTTTGAGRAENIVIQTLVELSTNDYIECFVENGTSITNVLVTNLNTTVK